MEHKISQGEILTIPEVSTKIRMSTAWIRQKIFRKEIKYLKIGRRIFIPQSTVDEIMQKAVIEPKGKVKLI